MLSHFRRASRPLGRQMLSLRLLSSSPPVFSSTSVSMTSSNTGVFHLVLPGLRGAPPCQHTLFPATNVSTLRKSIIEEDSHIETVTITTQDGTKVAGATPMSILLQEPFVLRVNGDEVNVQPPENARLFAPETAVMRFKETVAELHASLAVQDHIESREEKLKRLKDELAPLEDMRDSLTQKAKKKTRMFAWGLLGVMSLQFGVLARLTYFEYSWDIVEPLSYFVGSGTALIAAGYYMLKEKDFDFAGAQERKELELLHKGARRAHFDVSHYNDLKATVERSERELAKLRGQSF